MSDIAECVARMLKVDKLNLFDPKDEGYHNDKKFKGETLISSIIPGEDGAKKFHMGQIDFLTDDESTAKDVCYNVAAKFGLPSWILLHSGNSFHAYFGKRFNVEEWHAFLGELLLQNTLDDSYIIDSRWIGASLVRGYSGLRITANNEYKFSKIPTLVHAYEETDGIPF